MNRLFERLPIAFHEFRNCVSLKVVVVASKKILAVSGTPFSDSLAKMGVHMLTTSISVSAVCPLVAVSAAHCCRYVCFVFAIANR